MDKHIQASFFWTAHNEIEAKWDYVKAWDMAFINKTVIPDDKIKPYPDFTPSANVSIFNNVETATFL